MNRNKIITVAVAFVYCAMAVCAQETPHCHTEPFPPEVKTKDYPRHRILFHYGMGYANSMYDRTDKSFMHDDYSFSSALELRYAYFFAPKWGIGLGAGLSYFAADGLLNIEGIVPQYSDPAFDPSGQHRYDLHYKTHNMVEQQRILALETPLQFFFEHRNTSGKRGIFASLGAKGYLPFISTQSAFRQGKGTLTLTGYEPFTGTWYTDPPHFGSQEIRIAPATTALRYSIDAIAEFGGLFRLSGVCDLFAGVYGSYGFMDVLPVAADKKDFITPEPNNLFTVNPLLSSNVLGEYNRHLRDNDLTRKKADEKWNRWQAGIKIGIHFRIR